ncbi:MAG: DUF3887 domain-containing protein [Bacteroidales bacterium]
MKRISLLLLSTLLLAGVAMAQDSPQVKVCKEIIDNFKARDFKKVSASFDETMMKALPEAKLEEVWNALNQQCGAYEKYSEITTEQIPGYEVVYLLCHFKQVSLRMKTVFSKDGKVAGLFFLPVDK